MITMIRECPICHKVSEVCVDDKGYLKYIEGELCQDAFPDLSATEREIIISGMCKECQDMIFGGIDFLQSVIGGI